MLQYDEICSVTLCHFMFYSTILYHILIFSAIWYYTVTVVFCKKKLCCVILYSCSNIVDSVVLYEAVLYSTILCHLIP